MPALQALTLDHSLILCCLCQLYLQANSPFNFYSMPQQERTKWLDDGLHLTELAYDTVGELVAEEIKRRVCSNAVTNN